jgi:Uma2 family endonuclease
MTMSLTGPRFTYEDYKLLPEDKRYEIIEGELLVTPAPNTRHQKILFRLGLKVGNWAEEHGAGTVLHAPTDVILSSENVIQPDLLFVCKAREGIVDPNGGINGAPDLVVEALSQSTASRDQVVKRKLYSKYGVREYWIVDPSAQSIEVLSFVDSGLETWQVFTIGSTLVSPLLRGLQLSTAEVFAD